MAYSVIKEEGESLAVAATAVTFASAPAAATRAKCQVLDAPVRIYCDNSTPTAAAGYRKEPGEVFELFGTEIGFFKAIREGGGSAVVVAQFYSGTPDSWDN